MEDLMDLMKSALASYEAAGVDGSEGARAMRGAIARIAQLEAERDAAEAKLREAVKIAKSIVRDWESTEEDRWPGGAEEECSSYASRASRIAQLQAERDAYSEGLSRAAQERDALMWEAQEEKDRADAAEAKLREAVELIDYITQDELQNRLVPRLVDIAYTAFMAAKKPNAEDFGPSDWFTDTKPMVMKAVAEVRRATLARLTGEVQG